MKYEQTDFNFEKEIDKNLRNNGQELENPQKIAKNGLANIDNTEKGEEYNKINEIIQAKLRKHDEWKKNVNRKVNEIIPNRFIFNVIREVLNRDLTKEPVTEDERDYYGNIIKKILINEEGFESLRTKVKRVKKVKLPGYMAQSSKTSQNFERFRSEIDPEEYNQL